MLRKLMMAAVIALAAAPFAAISLVNAAAEKDDGYLEPKLPDKSALASVGKNDYFILEPGYQLRLETKDGKDYLTVTVLNETKTLDGVETRIVEERETKGGELIEVSRNYFAIGKETHDVFYFGEDVDMYKAGKVTSHEGSWHAGENGAKAGLAFAGKPTVGMKFYEEQAPKVAMDRKKIVSLTEEVKTPAGVFKNCLKTEESTPLEKGEEETKVYAPGVGLLKDEDFLLVKYGKVETAK